LVVAHIESGSSGCPLAVIGLPSIISSFGRLGTCVFSGYCVTDTLKLAKCVALPA
jgi:hypothetical protein